MSWFCLSFRPQHSISFFLTGSQHPIPTLDSGSVGGYKGVDQTDWKPWNWLTYWWAEDLSSPINTIKTHNWTEVVTKQKLRVSFEIFGFIAVLLDLQGLCQVKQGKQHLPCHGFKYTKVSLCPSISQSLLPLGYFTYIHLSFTSVPFCGCSQWL